MSEDFQLLFKGCEHVEVRWKNKCNTSRQLLTSFVAFYWRESFHWYVSMPQHKGFESFLSYHSDMVVQDGATRAKRKRCHVIINVLFLIYYSPGSHNNMR